MMTLEQLSDRLGACPANAWLGLVPREIDDSGVTFSVPVRPEMAGNPLTGALHGGMLAAIIDTLCSFAWLVRSGGSVSTVDMRIDYHRPVLVNELIGKGRLVRAGRRIVTADAEITDTDGRLLVSGRAVMIPIAN